MAPVTPHVVIVGGGFGGLAAARALRGAPIRVTLLDRNNYHVFQPLLYQVATAGLSPGDIASPIRWILRNHRNVQVLLADVVSVDVERKMLQLADGTLAYDYVILATGASHSYFGHDEWEAAAPGLKTMEDALRMRRQMLLAFELAERTDDPAGAAPPAHLRDRRGRTDGRGTGRRACRDLRGTRWPTSTARSNPARPGSSCSKPRLTSCGMYPPSLRAGRRGIARAPRCRGAEEHARDVDPDG